MEPRSEVSPDPSLRPAGPGGHELVRPELAAGAPPSGQLLFNPLKMGGLPGLEPLHALPPPQLHPLQLQQQLYSLALQQLQQARQAAPPPPWAAVPYPYKLLDPRLVALCRPPEEPKPQHSYIGLIAMAILSSAERKLVLSDIYQYILDNYSYFRNRGTGWRNSIRHNLSLNDCFIKAGRSPNGKGHFWAIHPANVDDFRKGDFRRRKAQRRVRKHMGLTVEDEDSMSPPPPPAPAWAALPAPTPRRRQFDVASLLAPDEPAEPRHRPEAAERELDVVGEEGAVESPPPPPPPGCAEPAASPDRSSDAEITAAAAADGPVPLSFAGFRPAEAPTPP
ncbi:forkhead box protein E3-like [Amphibalanus amphitrite]|uniref:forkhead box protein E3-like n=1 Tax=Amphibalanus amphitrite TaxID=1232801 RepID=UPI001C9101E4|nr:forkhead box protein E3-like [Amphibalanus amphitrite]